MKVLTEGTGAADKEQVQASEDATKWNECLLPECIAIMHNVFLTTDSPSAAKMKEIFWMAVNDTDGQRSCGGR